MNIYIFNEIIYILNEFRLSELNINLKMEPENKNMELLLLLLEDTELISPQLDYYNKKDPIYLISLLPTETIVTDLELNSPLLVNFIFITLKN